MKSFPNWCISFSINHSVVFFSAILSTGGNIYSQSLPSVLMPLLFRCSFAPSPAPLRWRRALAKPGRFSLRLPCLFSVRSLFSPVVILYFHFATNKHSFYFFFWLSVLVFLRSRAVASFARRLNALIVCVLAFAYCSTVFVGPPPPWANVSKVAAKEKNTKRVCKDTIW